MRTASDKTQVVLKDSSNRYFRSFSDGNLYVTKNRGRALVLSLHQAKTEILPIFPYFRLIIAD